ncbi:Tc5 transposase DNA-binding domain [Phytophthora infestans]|uniref:Tc5 transposase DNA-binding domain n=1 Tax=Phytophthora infestans TaxID=4787 RepID=A0A8S9UU99_PHYIN|nr:Tc5 transposase DNA-binding domain [Phytophthora infestans]
MSTSRSRHHLTIADKNRLRRHHQLHPELTQEQLREWAYATFGQWVARSTVGHIVRAPEEVCANPEATRFQSGRYPDMEQELYAFIVARATQLGVDLKQLDSSGGILSDSELWTKANEILKRTRGSQESVSVAWVHRFKKRHGLHRSQLKRAATEAATLQTVTEQTIEEQVSNNFVLDTELAEPARKKAATVAGNRSHFVSSDDILLLTHVLAIKPWTFPYVMDGWQQVTQNLRREESFRLDKTAGACQARLSLLLSHFKADNTMALRKSGTDDEFNTKCALLAEVTKQTEEYDKGKSNLPVVAAESSPSVQPNPVALNIALPDLVQERERMAQRRLELMERKMERELAAQKRHSEQQVARLEKLHHEQQQVQQEQHAQLLATIQQQQAMMFDLIKSLAPAPVESQEQAQA